MNELDAPLGLGLDGARHDRAHNHAAVAVFGLTALAILGGGIGWYVLRAGAAQPTEASPVAAVAFPAQSAAAVLVPADAPMLRQEIQDEPATAASRPARSITIIDGKTGKRETILLGSSDDDAPADGIVPAAASADAAPQVVR